MPTNPTRSARRNQTTDPLTALLRRLAADADRPRVAGWARALLRRGQSAAVPQDDRAQKKEKGRPASCRPPGN